MLFWNKICGLTSTFFMCVLFSSAQVSYVIKSSATNQFNKEYKSSYNILSKATKKEVLNPFTRFTVVPQNYYTQHFGFMCKKELAIEKATKIPFRFRLGSLQQCNYLEGKR